MKYAIVAVLEAKATNNTPAARVNVIERFEPSQFVVAHADGRQTSTKVDAFVCDSLRAALAFAVEEIRLVLEG